MTEPPVEASPAGPGAATIPRWDLPVAFALFATAAAVLVSVSGLDLDFFWHVKVGELLLAGARPDLHDPFSWTAHGHFWLDHEWLGEEGWAFVLAHAHLAGVLALHKLALVLELGLLYLLARQAGCTRALGAAAALAAGLMLYPWYLPRLQLASGVGLTLTLLMLQAWYRGRLHGYWPMAYLPMVALWANLHGGGALSGPASVILVAAWETVASRKQRTVAGLWAMAAAGLGGVLLTPAGLGLPAFTVATMVDPRLVEMNQFIDEWGSSTRGLGLDISYPLWLGALLALLAATRRLPARGLVVLALVWSVLALGSYRHIPLGAIATFPLLAAALAGPLPALVRGLVSLLALLLVALHPLVRSTPFGRIGQPLPSPAALVAVKAASPGHHLLNHYAWGGELLFVGYPELQVYIDGRQYLYGLQRNREYYTLSLAAPGYLPLLERDAIDRAFFPPAAPLVAALRKQPGWRVAFEDPTAVLLVRDPQRARSPR